MVKSTINFKDPIGNRNHYHSTCSTVSQQTGSRVTMMMMMMIIIIIIIIIIYLISVHFTISVAVYRLTLGYRGIASPI